MLQIETGHAYYKRNVWMFLTHKFYSIFILSSSLTLFTNASIVAGEQETPDKTPYQHKHNGQKYPPILLITNINSPSITQLLSGHNAFSRVDKEAFGLPIGIRILKLHRTKSDSTQFSTLMLAASTLGIVPIVSNSEFKVRYDVFVQGEIVSTFTYQTESTDATNLWSGPDKVKQTKPAEERFIEYTVTQFLNELKDSKETQALFQEYREYYGSDT
jgi:hypothetical protein